MKRRRIEPQSILNPQDENELLNAIPITRPTEGTLALEVGTVHNRRTTPYYGVTPNISLAGVLSDVDTLQYDEFFSLNDQFTFTPRNCLIGLVVMVYYDPAATNPAPPAEVSGKYALWIVPITLPWTKMSLGDLEPYSTASSDPQTAGTINEGRSLLHRLQDQLVYALNILWNFDSNPSGGNLPWQPFIPPGNGWVLSKEYFNRIDKTDYMHPMWVDFHNDPLPLVWFRGPNGELGIKRNGSFDDGTTYGCARFALNFMTIPENFLNANNFYNRTLNTTINPLLIEDCPGPSSTSSMLNDENGWIGGGPFVFGIGNHNTTRSGYVDDYFDFPAVRQAIFDASCFPYQETTGPGYPACANYAAYRTLLSSFKLKEEICMGTRVASITPSRFFIVSSQILTRNQRLRYESNNMNASSSDILGLVFPPTDSTSIFAKTNTLTNFIDPFETNTNAVLHSNRTDPKQVVDLDIRDEFFHPFMNVNPANREESFFMLGYNQRNFYPPKNFNGGISTLPTNISSLNPDTVTYPDGDCLLVAQHLSQLSFFVTYVDQYDASVRYNIRSPSFSITCPAGSWMLHFVRLFGRG